MRTSFFLIVLAFGGAADAGWVTLDMPGAAYTLAYGIDGGIVGYYGDSSPNNLHGFLYDGSAWTALNARALRTLAYGIDGDSIVGYYDDGRIHERDRKR